jgi:hypothetical protein
MVSVRYAPPSIRRTCATLLMLAAALGCAVAHAETRVVLLRGWFGVFSTGLDRIADDVRVKGVKADTIGHLQWQSSAASMVKERGAGTTGRIVLVGHSQGGNDAIKLARELEAHGVAVDLLITLAPWQQDPVPRNVVKAVNFFQAGGWGSPLVAAPGSRGEIANVDIGNDAGTYHINIDKNKRVQAEVVAMIVALERPR